MNCEVIHAEKQHLDLVSVNRPDKFLFKCLPEGEEFQVVLIHQIRGKSPCFYSVSLEMPVK